RRRRTVDVVAVRAVDALAAHSRRRSITWLSVPHDRLLVRCRCPRGWRDARWRDGWLGHGHLIARRIVDDAARDRRVLRRPRGCGPWRCARIRTAGPQAT